MTAERLDDSGLEPGQLHVDLDGEAEPRREGERVVERRRLRRQVGPVGEHERAVGAAEHVELDRVDPERGRRLDRARLFSGARAAAPRCPTRTTSRSPRSSSSTGPVSP